MTAAEKHYLVWRDESGLWKLEVFADLDEALFAYERAEKELPMLGEVEVCLFWRCECEQGGRDG